MHIEITTSLPQAMDDKHISFDYKERHLLDYIYLVIGLIGLVTDFNDVVAKWSSLPLQHITQAQCQKIQYILLKILSR